ncbi:hypothetical protein FHL15_007133 [Xylaria flabelliformis]|uniref:RanBD1 domain-containing protein n=1 Tax=Xylaria flabelliformis TaxID=2512241 RepID=A0A553HVQ5_9PEZI|nr:hypothetical protein FHL15_007133 [Xylaria flabelliformis]
MSFNSTPYKSRPPPGQLGSTPFRSSSASKFRSSLVPTSRPSPARTSNSPVKLSKISNGARDLFRTSSPRGQRTTEFTPDLPAEVTRPRASLRKFAPRKSVSTGMSNTASTEPFKMRIPSPDPDLTGQALAREVPDDPNRAGSIYADQFLAHKCPPHFDEIQRRQFFCILDLRRLKYAADEIFAKKDWKLNILNFAKEYEKSRGLIMLRYGLYEFKSVKPSSEVLKKWRAAHGLPPEPEEANGANHQKPRTPGPAGATKRKAAEELTPNANTLMASTANQNKRRTVAHEDDDPIHNGPALFKKSKRKADETEEVDENKPNKQQKSTPSTATSLFESIINKPRDGGVSPSKPISQSPSLFGVSKPKDSQDAKFATKANPFQSTDSGLLFGTPKLNNSSIPSGSVLSAHKVGATPTTNTGNIFSYLSESSTSSSGNENENDDDNDDRESDDEPEQDSEDQGPSAAVSTDTSTPPIQNGPSLFSTGTTSSTSNIFGGLPKPSDQSTKGGLFGRVQMGANGQPVRVSPGPDEKQSSSVNQPPTTKETPAKRPGDYTFDPTTTPISFGTPTLDVSKSSSTTDIGPNTKPDASESKKPASIFGVSSQPSSGSAPNAPSLFGSSTNAKLSEATSSIFAPQKPAPSIFGTPSTNKSSIFGLDAQKSEAAPATKKQAVNALDKPAPSASTTSETKPPANNDADKPVSSSAAIESKVPSIFDKSFIANNAAQAKTLSDSSKPSPDLFSRNSNPLFGSVKDSKIDSSIPPSKDQAKDQPPSIFDKSFIANNAAQVKKLPDSPQPSPDLFSRGSNPLFGSAGAGKTNGTTAPAGTKSIFGQSEKPVSSTTTSNNIATPSTTSIFGQTEKPVSSTISSNNIASPSIFGQQGGSKQVASASTIFGQKKIEEPAKPTSSIFGQQKIEEFAKPTSSIFGQKKVEEPAKTTSSIFGNTPSAPGPVFSFGSQPISNAASQSPSMNFGTAAIPGPSVSFSAPNSQATGGDSKKVGFQFGNSGPSVGSASFTFGQDSSAGSSFTFTAGADKQSVNNPFAASQPSSQPPAPVFGGNSSTTPSSSFNFSFGQPSSTPKTMPPSQGSGLFGGSAPKITQSSSLFGGSTTMNGAPSFSFTQASPSQNSSDVKFPKSSAVNPFGHLQANEGSAVARTTPVNGTPEPQSPREDGEEAPQEQIKLTDGGPGEEDETILHEVRAKAIKYIPVQKGDEDEAKSPWSTRGVGPLRVLKNKSTGLVRILLRAEPRGHIAMNKTILSDVEYKAKEKTLNLVAASDDGSCLETWLLQVKKPEFAAELARVLEANKAANKK